jgi:hypothetical protein
MYIDGIDDERDFFVIRFSFDDNNDENEENPLDFVTDSIVCS